jgi:hypothetical protein
MQNAYMTPRTYEIPVTKIQNNLKKYKEHGSLLLINYKHYLKPQNISNDCNILIPHNKRYQPYLMKAGARLRQA